MTELQAVAFRPFLTHPYQGVFTTHLSTKLCCLAILFGGDRE
jgi:hypothetical protein